MNRLNPPLQVTLLEERDVPSAATLDLSHSGASGSIGGVLFTQENIRHANLDSIVRLQASGKSGVEQGYDTSARPLAYDQASSRQATQSEKVADLPRVVIHGTAYREIVLDINQKNSSPYLSLDALQVYVSNNASLSGKIGSNSGWKGATLTYDMDAHGDAWIKTKDVRNDFTGSGDVVVDIPESLLSGGTYFYLYSKFGVNIAANGAYEEWGTKGHGGGPIKPAAVSGSISGTISYNDATVPSGVTVLLILNGQTVQTTTTDSSGAYTFKNLPASGSASYMIEVPATSFMQSNNLEQTSDTSTEVSLAANQTLTHVDLTLSFGGSPS